MFLLKVYIDFVFFLFIYEYSMNDLATLQIWAHHQLSLVLNMMIHKLTVYCDLDGDKVWTAFSLRYFSHNTNVFVVAQLYLNSQTSNDN